MTIQGAMNELINLLNADDIPVYYKGGIQKVIETIDDYIDGKDDYVKRRAEQTEPQILDDIGRQIQDAYDKGIISDADATQAWYEAVNKTEPQTDCSWK